MSGRVQKVVTICNKKGLHARAAAKFVKTAAQFESSLKVTRIGALDEAGAPLAVGGTSILGLMLLGAETGTELQLDAEGSDADQAVNAIETLIVNKFDEGE